MGEGERVTGSRPYTLVMKQCSGKSMQRECQVQGTGVKMEGTLGKGKLVRCGWTRVYIGDGVAEKNDQL